nr:MAG TPA: restriction alleviation protein [Caudoviricetes sp.]
MLAVDAHPAGKLHKPACGFCGLRGVQSLLGLVRRSTTTLHTAAGGRVGPCVRRLP